MAKRFQLVTGTPFYTTCVICGTKGLAGDGYQVYADLNGKPFVDYYCERDYRNFQLALQDAETESLEGLEAAAAIYDSLHGGKP